MDRIFLKVLKFIYQKRKSDIDVPMLLKKFHKIEKTEILNILNDLKKSNLITSWNDSAKQNKDYLSFVAMYFVFDDSHLEITQEGISLIELERSKSLKSLLGIVKYAIGIALTLLGIWVAWVVGNR